MKGLITGVRDRSNLNFLLTSNKKVLDKWYKRATDDDRTYAHELLESYALELKVASEELKIECQLIKMADNYLDAQKILRKISVG